MPGPVFLIFILKIMQDVSNRVSFINPLLILFVIFVTISPDYNFGEIYI